MATLRFIKVPERVLDDLTDGDLCVLDESLRLTQQLVTDGKYSFNGTAGYLATLNNLRDVVMALRKALVDADER